MDKIVEWGLEANFLLAISFAVVSLILFFVTRFGAVRPPILFFARVLGYSFAIVALREFLWNVHLGGRNFLVLNLTAFAVGLSVLGMVIGRSLYWRRQPVNWLNLVAIFLQVVIGALVFGAAILSPAESLAIETITNADLIFSSFTSVILLFLITILGLIYFQQVDKFFKYSPFFVLAIFTPALLNLTAWSLYYVPSLLAISIAGIIATVCVSLYAHYRHMAVSHSLFDRNGIINSMNLGWMILDQDNMVVDVNPFIEIITGLSADKLKGRAVDDWMVNGNILVKSEDFSQSSFRASVNFNGFTYAFDVRSLPLQDSDNNFTGRLFLWQDVTEQRKLEESRYRVLATKINLMRSISSAANHITDIDVFLEAAIFQIVSSFGCLAGFIFVRDSDFIGDDKAGFRLEAAYSYSVLLDSREVAQNFGAYFANLESEFGTVKVYDAQSGIFLDGNDGPDAPGKLLMCPIVIDEHLQGLVCLFREENSPYDEDELIGLEMITNELSMLVYVDHQRREAVSFSERKKLVKDLHDTVTQQLYGLLYQVEIAQAQSELGEADRLPGSLVKIGDTARQALREMRLFLHELRPIDLKSEGLVSALHHRLTAVEGRANLQPRFISSDGLEISMQQELNLYHIAREALNNVLRHSHAKNVVVHLRQNRNNICLEISDDGVGFEKSVAKNSGGMGLKNIQSWTAQIHAKLQMRSEPGKGTTIKVLVPRNK